MPDTFPAVGTALLDALPSIPTAESSLADPGDAYGLTSLLVRWSEIELLEFTEVAADG